MFIARERAALEKYIESMQKEQHPVGLVPTMGALHEGHLALVREALHSCKTVVVSVFVNPRQFNNPDDLKNYPHTEEADIALLEAEGVQCVFLPTPEEVYTPDSKERHFDFGLLDKVMEGKYRPGHFEGVAQVVSRLFDLVKPDVAFFGEKDFQQLAIIRYMVAHYGFPLKIVGVPIVREESGLARSSRNSLLSPSERAAAPTIYATLKESRLLKEEGKSVAEVIAWVTERLNSTEHLEVEYFTIVNEETLEEITHWSDAKRAVGCVTCYCGHVRLIDNIRYH
ncbi:pantoate--beta-alanine ligase [Porphyromonas miyakawae]|uniref:Pantothenate synthetase n=1 Tax=Porphyromonas miyakawae TaxID=3137470 RepID=A0ABQ0E317_9PORP